MMARWKIWTALGSSLLLSLVLVTAPSFAVGDRHSQVSGRRLSQGTAGSNADAMTKNGTLAPSIPLVSINPNLQSFPTTTLTSGQLLNIPLTSLEWIMNDTIPGEYVNALERVKGSALTIPNTMVTFTYSDGKTVTATPSGIVDINGTYFIDVTIPTVSLSHSGVSIGVDAVSQGLHAYLWNVRNSGNPILGTPTSMPGSPARSDFIAAPVPVFTIEPPQVAGQLPEIPYAAALPIVMLGVAGLYWRMKKTVHR